MIPRCSIAVEQDVDFSRLVAPGPATAAYPAWLGTQRDYDPSVYGAASWDAAQRAAGEETRALQGIAAGARDPDHFDELAYEQFELERPLELGVSGLCIALNAAGCVTAFSCRGHPRLREYPQVLLASDEWRAKVLAEHCRAEGCGIDNFEQTGLVIFAPSVLEFVELASALCADRERFPPRAW